ncbi:MAG: cohesin domain-containing protein [Planctomycetota bacterium]
MSFLHGFTRCGLLALFSLVAASPASGALSISFSADDESIRVGETIDVTVFLNQTGSATPVDITTVGVTGAEIQLSLDTLAAQATDLSFGDGFADLFSLSDLSVPSSPILSVLSINTDGVTAPAGLPTSIEIGTFTFTGVSVGTTVVTNIDQPGFTQFTFDGITTDFDDQIFGSESFTLNVMAIPEPGSMTALLAMSTGMLFRRRRRPVGTESSR